MIINNPYTTTTGTTAITGYYTGYSSYNTYLYDRDSYRRDIIMNNAISSLPESKPKKLTFEDKLQDEIDDWLDIFKEN